MTPKLKRVISYNEEVQKSLSETSFANPNCTSWWKTENGDIPNNWPGTAIQYQELLSKIDWEDFEAEGEIDAIKDRQPTLIGRVVEETRMSVGTMAVVAGVTVAATLSGISLILQRPLNFALR